MLLALIALPVSADTLTPQQQQDVIAKINKTASNIKSMSCSFVQTKYLSILNDKMVSKGQMYYKQSDKLRWEYTEPYKYLFIFNGTKVYVGNSSRKDVIDTNSNKVFKEVARIMMNTVTGKALSNSTDFSVDATADSKYYTITLVPKKKDLKQMFSKIVLNFTKSNTMISEVNIYEKNGDRSNIQLKNISNNGTVNESYFNIPK
jgi:outer membrane lipoprotein carrier protein